MRTKKVWQAYDAKILDIQCKRIRTPHSSPEGFNDWGGRGNDDFIPGEVTKTTPSGDETT